MEMAVEGIVSGNILGVNVESTAQKQSRFAKFWEAHKEKRKAKAEARQAKRDEKDFQKIRSMLISHEKVFGISKQEMEEIMTEYEQAQADIEGGVSRKSQLLNTIRISKGARENQKVLGRNLKSSAVTGILSTAGSATAVISLALSFWAPQLALIGLGLTTVAGIAAFIANKVTEKKLKKGSASDTFAKDENTIREIENFLKQLENFTKRLEEKYKGELVKKKQTLNKYEFELYLDKFVERIRPDLEELGIADFVKKLSVAEMEQLNQGKQSTATAGVMS